MTEKASFYGSFRLADTKDFEAFFKKIDKNALLYIPREIIFFCKTALSKEIFKLFGYNCYILEDLKPQEEKKTIVIPCTDDPSLLLHIIDECQKVPNFDKRIIMMPRFGPICQTAFENSTLKNQTFHVSELHIEVIPLAENQFIVPLKLAYTNLYCDFDMSDIYSIARALLKVQLINGRCSRVFVAGSVAHKVYSLMNEMTDQVGKGHLESTPKYDDLFIIDRSCDNVTPFITQCTYGGLIDEFFNIDFKHIKLPPNVQFKEDKNKFYEITENDTVFSEIDGLSVLKALDWLKSVTEERKNLSENLSDYRGSSQWRILKVRAEKIINMNPYIDLHFKLFELLPLGNVSVGQMLSYEMMQVIGESPSNKIIFDLIHRGQLTEAIRMLILTSVTSRGVPQSLIEKVGNKLIATLGFGFLKEWNRLLSAGLVSKEVGLFSKEKRGPKFQTVCEQLKLMLPPDPPDAEPTPIKQFYQGYVPLSVRLVEAGLKSEWAEQTPAAKIMKQSGIDPKVYKTEKYESSISCNMRRTNEGKPFRRVLVFIIGGMTKSEMMMFSQLGDLEFSNTEMTYQFHIGTTDVITGNRLIRQICPSLTKANK